YNQGNSHFSFKPLPLAAQFSKVFSVITDNFEKDSGQNILLSGNFYPYRTQLGQCDASLGLLLKNTGQDFVPIDPSVSGCYIGGDVRGMVEIKNKTGEKLVIIAKNNDSVQVLKVND